MDWKLARERLGAELIGAREDVATRWRQILWQEGAAAELRAALLDESVDAKLGFGGVKAICWTAPDEPADDARAA
jgi:hypothetical protein